MFRRITESPSETAALAALFGARIKDGVVICLEGDLGAGKTCFVQGLAGGLDVKSEVTSPTYNLMNIYEGRFPIYHFDLYRLETEEELEEIGFYEYANATGSVILIEWPDRFTDALPDDYIHVKIERTLNGDNERCIILSLAGLRYEALFKELNQFC
jgi:tRNA threonylcarbamoyladenosine biosynthesis protein TsaE